LDAHTFRVAHQSFARFESDDHVTDRAAAVISGACVGFTLGKILVAVLDVHLCGTADGVGGTGPGHLGQPFDAGGQVEEEKNVPKAQWNSLNSVHAEME